MLEKAALPLNDGLAYALNRVEALLHILDEPAGFLQARL